MSTPLDKLRARLRRFSGSRRRLANGTLAWRLGSLAVMTASAALILLAGWLPSPWLNLGLALAAVIFWLVLLGKLAKGYERFRSELREGFAYEAQLGGLNSRIVSALDFLEHGPATPLTEELVRLAERDLEQAAESRLPRQPRNRQARRCLLWLLATLMLAFSPWFGVPRLLATLHASYLEARDQLFPVAYTLTPGAGRHIRLLGETQPLGLQLGRRAYAETTLHLQEGEEHQTVALPLDGENRATYDLSRTMASEVSAWFQFGTRRSEPMNIIFTSLPALEHMQVELIFPPYTRILPRSLEGVQTRLSALAGTQVSLGMTFSKELESVVLTWEDGEELPLEAVGRFASLQLVLNRPRRGSLQVTDLHGLRLPEAIPFELEVLADEVPRALLPRHLKEDLPMLEEEARNLSFGVRLEDDFGVTRALLKWQKSSIDNPTSVTERGELERLIDPVQRRAVLSFEKVLTGINLAPGDRFSFQVEVWDNRVPQAQKGVSTRFSLFIFQKGLEGLSIRELGFGALSLARERIGKLKRATSVKEPEGLQVKEAVRNEFEATILSAARAPTLGGDHSAAVRDYFRLLAAGATAAASTPAAPSSAPPDGGAPPEPEPETAPEATP